MAFNQQTFYGGGETIRPKSRVSYPAESAGRWVNQQGTILIDGEYGGLRTSSDLLHQLARQSLFFVGPSEDGLNVVVAGAVPDVRSRQATRGQHNGQHEDMPTSGLEQALWFAAGLSALSKPEGYIAPNGSQVKFTRDDFEQQFGVSAEEAGYWLAVSRTAWDSQRTAKEPEGVLLYRERFLSLPDQRVNGERSRRMVDLQPIFDHQQAIARAESRKAYGKTVLKVGVYATMALSAAACAGIEQIDIPPTIPALSPTPASPLVSSETAKPDPSETATIAPTPSPEDPLFCGIDSNAVIFSPDFVMDSSVNPEVGVLVKSKEGFQSVFGVEPGDMSQAINQEVVTSVTAMGIHAARSGRAVVVPEYAQEAVNTIVTEVDGAQVFVEGQAEANPNAENTALIEMHASAYGGYFLSLKEGNTWLWLAPGGDASLSVLPDRVPRDTQATVWTLSAQGIFDQLVPVKVDGCEWTIVGVEDGQAVGILNPDGVVDQPSTVWVFAGEAPPQLDLPDGVVTLVDVPGAGFVGLDKDGNPISRFADPDGPGGEPGQWVEAQAVEEGEDGRWSFWNRDMGTWQTPEEQADRVEKINGRTLVFQEGRYRPVYEYDTGAGELKSFVPKAAKVCEEFTSKISGVLVNDCDVFLASSFVPIDEAQIKPMFTQNEDGEMVPAPLGRLPEYDVDHETTSGLSGKTGFIRIRTLSCIVRDVAGWDRMAYENTIKVLCETVTPGGDSYFFSLIMPDQPGSSHGIGFFKDNDISQPIGNRTIITNQDVIDWFWNPDMRNQQLFVGLQIDNPDLPSDIVNQRRQVFNSIENGKLVDFKGYFLDWDQIYFPDRYRK